MLVLTIRTDNPKAEIGLYTDDVKLAYEIWEAHRQLAETIHKKIEVMLKQQDKSWQDLDGIVCFQGPGSFTGLRIGLSLGNALAYGLQVPIVASKGREWITKGLQQLQTGTGKTSVLPFYGAPVHITKPRQS